MLQQHCFHVRASEVANSSFLSLQVTSYQSVIILDSRFFSNPNIESESEAGFAWLGKARHTKLQPWANTQFEKMHLHLRLTDSEGQSASSAGSDSDTSNKWQSSASQSSGAQVGFSGSPCSSTDSNFPKFAGGLTSDSSGSDAEVAEGSGEELQLDHLASEIIQKAKRASRTAKARGAATVARVTRRLAKNANLKPPQHRAERFRSDIQEDSGLNAPGQSDKVHRHRRLRLLVSYMKAWCVGIVAFFQGFHDLRPRVHHTIVSAIVDDTNMKLATSVLPQWILSRTVAVMNIIQSLIVCHDDPLKDSQGPSFPTKTKTFQIHTPLVCLPRSDKDTLATEFMSRLILFLGRVSARFEKFGLVANFACNVPIQALTVCMDALVTNIAVVKLMRVALVQKHMARSAQLPNTIFPFLQVSCLVHQLALSRKILLNGFPHFYSSIVRLSHLFEIGTFRLQFRKAMLAVIYDSFRYVAVLQRPEEFSQWRERRNEICSVLLTSSSRYNRKRIQLHRALMAFDNGDPETDSIQHFCTGECCPGRDHAAKAQHALLQTCKFFTLLFGFGYPVPLAYRWVHAHRALQFAREA